MASFRNWPCVKCAGSAEAEAEATGDKEVP